MRGLTHSKTCEIFVGEGTQYAWCQKIEHCNCNYDTHSQNTTVLLIPMVNPTQPPCDQRVRSKAKGPTYDPLPTTPMHSGHPVPHASASCICPALGHFPHYGPPAAVLVPPHASPPPCLDCPLLLGPHICPRHHAYQIKP